MFHGSTVWVRVPRFARRGGGANAPRSLRNGFDRPTASRKNFRASVPSNPIMAQEQAIEVEGKITSVLAGTMFHVELANKHTVLAHISGKMRKRFIRLTNGDRVKMEMSPYDLSKARIVYRLG